MLSAVTDERIVIGPASRTGGGAVVEQQTDSDGTGFWRGRRAVVTGGAGFLGSFVVERLRAAGCTDIIVPRSADHDLTDPADVRRLYREARPDLVIHLAARVGGIGANRDNPGRFFHDNLMMGVNLIEVGRRAGVNRFVQVGTVCSYPKHAAVPFREDDLWNGYPEETNAPYGIAKKALLVQLQAYRAQYGFNGIYLLPANLYGPRDNFDLATGHVIAALIRKCVEARDAGASSITVWGTGTATREFFYVEDCAEAVVLAAEKYDSPEPVNLGTGREIVIADLVALIARTTGFEGDIVYDASRPDGQPRRALDVSRAVERFGFVARTRLEDGLRRTVNWFLEHRDNARLVRSFTEP
jgi:GDP-L-fucose synthase